MYFTKIMSLQNCAIQAGFVILFDYDKDCKNYPFGHHKSVFLHLTQLWGPGQCDRIARLFVQ